jgi:DNA relaxase NicK
MTARERFVSVGVDWVTATATDDKAVRHLAEQWQVWVQVAKQAGDLPKKDGRLGYRGFSVQRVFFGVRHDGCMVQASGFAADAWYNIIHEAGAHVTRLDLQVTGVVNGNAQEISQSIVLAALEGRSGKNGGRPRKVTRIEGFGDGDTVSVGSRSSNLFGRAYDKHAETPDEYPAGSWRFEVEYKQEHAQAALEALMNAENKTRTIEAMVRSFYEARGIVIPLDLTGDAPVLHLGKVTTSDDKTLNWLAKHVRPSVQRLVQAGKKEQVLLALGLTE